MIRAQRKLHARLWPLLTALLCGLIVVAMASRIHTSAAVDAALRTGPP